MLYQASSSILSPQIDSDIDNTVRTFSTHGLSDLSNSSLMDRVDSKFLIPINELINVINGCKNDYSVLKIAGRTKFQYNNLYFDSPNLDFYHHHHNQKLNRYKVRHRQYADVGSNYLEIKFKSNKGRTIKNRCLTTENALTALASNYSFIQDHGLINSKQLLPSQFCCYQRISLANKVCNERITLDLDINFSNALHQQGGENLPSYKLSNFFIAELKQEKLNRQSPFFRLMRKMSLRPKGFSKYCMGVSLTNNQQIKSNRFKANLVKLERGA